MSLPGNPAVATAAHQRGAARGGVEVVLDDLIAQRIAARSLVLAASRKVAAAQAGIKTSRFRGRGVDYVESRSYQPGDDIRSMDWRVTARTGRPHTKVFQEERERSVLLLLDHSPSMHFGTRVCFKSVQAARAAALIAWSAIRGGDRVGALGFGSGVTGEVRPAGGPRGVLHCLRALSDWDTLARVDRSDSATPLSAALERARRLARPGSLVILLSDGFCADAAAEAPLARLAAHGDVRLLTLTDALELAAPPRGRYAIEVAGARRWLEFGGSADAQWVAGFRARRQLLLDQCKRLGIASLALDTRDDLSRRLAALGLALATRRSPG
ncbi:uncharacterized protein DUF58 [Tahibacter aquaticus]|uniref:Uncharacterized protein DUF58 n=1 Tax=Tahibacter aquaticus TaxID=520092 RepID=A0A4R6YU03_9GAMM|nr:DUF58 domain-containing protein [Tahibacter aquaticus]TDR41700.1 uncharacterized protein DUF58 [Tahibacter aquaticus]